MPHTPRAASLDKVRVASPADAATLAEIYAPYVRDTAVSFEVDPPDQAEMRRRLERLLPRFPWLACERNGEVVGYAYASPHRERLAYQWSADATVYVSREAHRSGVGRSLYGSLLRSLQRQGFRTVYGGITLPNEGSVGLHEAMGFRPIGVYREVGFKLGAWRDVGWWSLPLGAASPNPQPPRPFEPRLIDPAGTAAV